MNRTISIGISTCPNDTFAFHGILADRVDRRGLDFDFQLLDVQQLNDRLVAGDFDVAKVSFHAALMTADKIVVLPSGSALGFGVGPVLLTAYPGELPDRAFRERHGRSARVLCPGPTTTATMLFRLFFPNCGNPQHVLFSEIMLRLQSGDADFGVCIHEGRFTFRERGLHLASDLGTLWETATDSPLPLGGIVARRRLGTDILSDVQKTISDSIQYALAHREETLPTLRRYAQEFDDDVLMAHVDLYVNQWTEDLGEQGQRALGVLSSLAKERGIITAPGAALNIWGAEGS